MHQSFVCSHVPVSLPFLCDMAVTLLKQVSLWRLVEYSNKTLAQVVKLCERTTEPSLEVLSSSLLSNTLKAGRDGQLLTEGWKRW